LDAEMLHRVDAAKESEGRSIVDLNIDKLPDQTRIPVKDHDVIGPGSTRELHRASVRGELLCGLARAFDEH
jgi:hypothetical protein